MADGGWIKLHRKITKSVVWSDPQRLKLWILILTKARHTDGVVPFNGREQRLNIGQCITGRVALRDEMNLGVRPALKVNSSFIYRALKDFESLGMLNIESNSQYSVITVLNWDEYQQSEQVTNSSRTANEQLTNTNKNVENEQEVKPDSPAKAEPSFNYAGVIQYLNDKSGKHYHDTPSNRKLIHARLADGYTSMDIAQAINNVCKGWLNTESERYIRPTTIFAASKFEGYVNDVPYGKPKAEQDDTPAPTVDKFDPAKWAVTAYRSLGSVESVIETAKSDGVPITEEQIKTAVAEFKAERNDEE